MATVVYCSFGALAHGREAPAGFERQIQELTDWSTQCSTSNCTEEARKYIRTIQEQMRRAQTYTTNEERDALRHDILSTSDQIDAWARRYHIVTRRAASTN